MAISSINQNIHFGSAETVTLPFTAMTDGFLLIFVNAAVTGDGYLYLTIDNSIPFRTLVRNSLSATNLCPMKKGQTVKLNNSDGVEQLAYRFIPLVGG